MEVYHTYMKSRIYNLKKLLQKNEQNESIAS